MSYLFSLRRLVHATWCPLFFELKHESILSGAAKQGIEISNTNETIISYLINCTKNR